MVVIENDWMELQAQKVYNLLSNRDISKGNTCVMKYVNTKILNN